MFIDSDECVRETHACSQHASCKNNIGSYECTCLPHFIGDGKICTGKTQRSQCKIVRNDESRREVTTRLTRKVICFILKLVTYRSV